jgi:O-antigen/teichoic acid export membrane protein
VSADSLEPFAGASLLPITSSRKVVRNVLLNGASQSWSIVVSLITVPIVLRGIGPAAYGVFVLAWLVVGYAALFDLGLTAATVRAIAIQRALGDYESLQRTVETAVSALIGISVPGAIALLLITQIGARLVLHLPPQLENDALFISAVIAAAFAFNACMTIFLAVVLALQQFRLVAAQAMLVSTVTAISQIAIVSAGLGLRWLVLASFAIFALSLVIFVVPARRLLPGVSFRPRFHLDTFRALVQFGSARFAGQILLQVAYGVDRLVIAAFQPITVVTYYSVPLSITQKFVLLQATLGQAFFPSASELHGVRRQAQLRLLYLDVIKLVIVVTLPLAVLVAGFAWPILDAWLGPAFADQSFRILAALAVSYGLVALTIVPVQASDATGHVRWTLVFASISAAVTATLALILVRSFGAIGAAIAISIGVGITGLVFTYVVQRWLLGLPLKVMLRYAVIRPTVAAVGLAIYCWVVSPHVLGVVQVLGAMFVGILVYGALTILTRTWTKREWSLLRTFARTKNA